jgi:hypothetical protein
MGVHHSVIDRLIQRLQETVNVDERPRSGRLHVSMLPDSNVTITVGEVYIICYFKIITQFLDNNAADTVICEG